MSDNNITLIGNVTRDPEIKVTTGGNTKAVIGLAVNRRWQNRQTQQWEEQVSFFNVIAWRELADNIAATVTKGMRIMVSGRLEQRSWESDDGKRSVVEVVADEVGPSLRWAHAEVIRNPKDGGGPVAKPKDVTVPEAESDDAFSSEPF